MAFTGDIVERTKRNAWFREVVATGPHSQVVVMSIPPDGSALKELATSCRASATPQSWSTLEYKCTSQFVGSGSLNMSPTTTSTRSVKPRWAISFAAMLSTGFWSNTVARNCA